MTLGILFRFILTFLLLSENKADTWRLVKVSSDTSITSFNMSLALLSGEDVAGQTEVLHRPGPRGWPPSGYSWSLRHAPSSGSLAITVEGAGQEVWAQRWDTTLPSTQGRLGVYTHSQPARFYNLTVQQICV